MREILENKKLISGEELALIDGSQECLLSISPPIQRPVEENLTYFAALFALTRQLEKRLIQSQPHALMYVEEQTANERKTAASERPEIKQKN